eukprot:Nk52_evm10s373 gene=Nk52_evmTU10s373
MLSRIKELKGSFEAGSSYITQNEEPDSYQVLAGDSPSSNRRRSVHLPDRPSVVNIPNLQERSSTQKGSLGSLFSAKTSKALGENDYTGERGDIEKLFQASADGNKKVVEALIKENVDVNSVDEEGKTPLMMAICGDSKAVVKLLLQGSAVLDIGDNNGMAAIHWGALYGKAPILKLLLKHPDCNLYSTDDRLRTALHWSVFNTDIKVMKCILEADAFIDPFDESNLTPLMLAASNDDSKHVDVLLEYGADPTIIDKMGRNAIHYTAFNVHTTNAKFFAEDYPHFLDIQDVEGRTSLHLACALGNVPVILTYLKGGSDIDIQDNQGKTPLMISCIYGHKRAAHALIEHDALLDTRDRHGATALHYCARNNFIDLIKLLISKGADVTLPDNQGRIPISWAIQMCHTNGLGLLGKTLDGANIIDKAGSSLVHIAALSGNIEAVRFFEESGNDLDLLDKNLRTPLICSIISGNFAVVEYFLQKNVDIHVKDIANMTAVFYAAVQGKTDLCKELFNRGADLSIQTSDGETLLHALACTPHFETFQYIYERLGADKLMSPFLVKDHQGNLPMHVAARYGNLEFLKFIYGKTYMASPPNDYGVTPLHLASGAGDLPCVQFLCEQNADINAGDWYPRMSTPLDYADENHHEEVQAYLTRQGATSVMVRVNKHILAIQRKFRKFKQQRVEAERKKKDIEEMTIYCRCLVYEMGNWACATDTALISRSILDEVIDRSVLQGRIGIEKRCQSLVIDIANESAQKCIDEEQEKLDNIRNLCVQYGLDTILARAFEIIIVKEMKKAAEEKQLESVILKEPLEMTIERKIDFGAISEENMATLPQIEGIKSDAVNTAEKKIVLETRKTETDLRDVFKTQTRKRKGSGLHFAAGINNLNALKMIMQNSGDVDELDEAGRSALMHAIMSGSTDCAKCLLDKNSSVNVIDNEGRSALHWAVSYERVAMVKLLLKKGALFSIRDNRRITPLHLSSQNASTDIMVLLLKKCHIGDVNAFDEGLMTPLMWACSGGSPKHIQLLLQTMADVTLRDRTGRYCVHWAAVNSNSGCLKEVLKFVPGIVNKTDKENRTALHVAAANSNAAAIAILLSYNDTLASPVDNLGRTPLHYSAMNGDCKSVEVLLQRSDVFAVDSQNATALDYALHFNHVEVLTLLIKHPDVRENVIEKSDHTLLSWAAFHRLLSLTKELIKNGDDVNAFNSKGRTALHAASIGGATQIADLLLKNGASINALDCENSTPLLKACQSGQESVAHVLLDNGANVNAEDVNGRTPLYFACLCANNSLVKRLIDMGAEIDLRDNDGRSPLCCAAHSQAIDVMVTLLEKGVMVNNRDKDGLCPLHWAALAGNVEAVEVLLQAYAFPNFTEYDGQRLTPLDYSMIGNHTECRDLLFVYGGLSIIDVRELSATVIQAYWRGYMVRNGGHQNDRPTESIQKQRIPTPTEAPPVQQEENSNEQPIVEELSARQSLLSMKSMGSMRSLDSVKTSASVKSMDSMQRPTLQSVPKASVSSQMEAKQASGSDLSTAQAQSCESLSKEDIPRPIPLSKKIQSAAALVSRLSLLSQASQTNLAKAEELKLQQEENQRIQKEQEKLLIAKEEEIRRQQEEEMRIEQEKQNLAERIRKQEEEEAMMDAEMERARMERERIQEEAENERARLEQLRIEEEQDMEQRQRMQEEENRRREEEKLKRKEEEGRQKAEYERQREEARREKRKAMEEQSRREQELLLMEEEKLKAQREQQRLELEQAAKLKEEALMKEKREALEKEQRDLQAETEKREKELRRLEEEKQLKEERKKIAKEEAEELKKKNRERQEELQMQLEDNLEEIKRQKELLQEERIRTLAMTQEAQREAQEKKRKMEMERIQAEAEERRKKEEERLKMLVESRDLLTISRFYRDTHKKEVDRKARLRMIENSTSCIQKSWKKFHNEHPTAKKSIPNSDQFFEKKMRESKRASKKREIAALTIQLYWRRHKRQLLHRLRQVRIQMKRRPKSFDSLVDIPWDPHKVPTLQAQRIEHVYGETIKLGPQYTPSLPPMVRPESAFNYVPGYCLSFNFAVEEYKNSVKSLNWYLQPKYNYYQYIDHDRYGLSGHTDDPRLWIDKVTDVPPFSCTFKEVYLTDTGSNKLPDYK